MTTLLVNKLCFFIFLTVALGKVEVPKYDIPEKLLEYLLGTRLGWHQNFNFIGIIIHDENFHVVDRFLRFNWHFTAIIADAMVPFQKVSHPEIIKTIVCFVDEETDFPILTDYINKYPFLEFNGNIRFVVTELVPNKDWLVDVFEYVWSQNILNFVVLFQVDDRVQIMGFNPFNRTVLDFSHYTEKHKMFIDKLQDMHGYPLFVAMYADVPRNRIGSKGGELIGKDVNLAKEIGKTLNATLKMTVYENFDEVNGALLDNKADFSFVKTFMLSNTNNTIDPAYPSSIDYLVLLVPTAEKVPQYKNLFYVFHRSLWLALLASVLLVAFFSAMLARCKAQRTSDAVLVAFRVTTNSPAVSCAQFSKSHASVKTLLIVWLFCSSLLTTSFNSALRSSLITPIYENEIETMQELVASGLRVKAPADLVQSLSENFGQISELLDLTDGSYADEIARCTKDKAYLTHSSYAEIHAKVKDKNNRFVYRSLKDHLGAGHSCYDFSRNSPYKEKIEERLILFREFALGSFGLPYEGLDVRVEGGLNSLTVWHLQSAFYILISGLVLSAVAFVVEEIYGKLAWRMVQVELVVFLRSVVEEVTVAWSPENVTLLLCVWAPLMTLTGSCANLVDWYHYYSLALFFTNVASGLLCAYGVLRTHNVYYMLPFGVLLLVDYMSYIATVFIILLYDKEESVPKYVLLGMVLLWLVVLIPSYYKCFWLYLSYFKKEK